MALRQFYKTVVVGTPVEYTISTFYSPISVAIVPGNGGTMSMYYKLVDESSWIATDQIDVASRTELVIDYPVLALKFTATTQNGAVEILQS